MVPDVLQVARASTCAYMRRHAPRPWHQLAYEDLDNSTSRAQAIAAIYRHVGVHDNWTGWHDVRRRQSSREADAISLFLGRGRVRPVGRAHPAGPEPAARQPRQTFIHRSSRVPVCGCSLWGARMKSENLGVEGLAGVTNLLPLTVPTERNPPTETEGNIHIPTGFPAKLLPTLSN